MKRYIIARLFNWMFMLLCGIWRSIFWDFLQALSALCFQNIRISQLCPHRKYKSRRGEGKYREKRVTFQRHRPMFAINSNDDEKSFLKKKDEEVKSEVQTDLFLWHPETLFWFNKHGSGCNRADNSDFKAKLVDAFDGETEKHEGLLARHVVANIFLDTRWWYEMQFLWNLGKNASYLLSIIKLDSFALGCARKFVFQSKTFHWEMAFEFSIWATTFQISKYISSSISCLK